MAGKKSKRGHPGLPETMLEAVATRFRTLGVPSRLRIVGSLMDGPLGMAELEEVTGLEQSNLSRQVTELERAGCVARRREGRTVQVEIADASLSALCDLVCSALGRPAST